MSDNLIEFPVGFSERRQARMQGRRPECRRPPALAITQSSDWFPPPGKPTEAEKTHGEAAEGRRLRNRLVAIVRKAVSVDARKERFPRTWLFHRRWGRPAAASTARGEPVEFLTIAGRTTAWVPSRQG